MKASEGNKCCICGEQAVERAFDDTGWCQIHLSDWEAFYRRERANYDNLNATFRAWLQLALASQTART